MLILKLVNEISDIRGDRMHCDREKIQEGTEGRGKSVGRAFRGRQKSQRMFATPKRLGTEEFGGLQKQGVLILKASWVTKLCPRARKSALSPNDIYSRAGRSEECFDENGNESHNRLVCILIN